jgi:hypothetical protein
MEMANCGRAFLGASGKTVMPGIIEAHAHLGYWKDLKPAAEHFTREQLLFDLQRFAYHTLAPVIGPYMSRAMMTIHAQQTTGNRSRGR